MALAIASAVLAAGWVVAPPASAAPHEKQVICHATSSVGHPYTFNDVDVDSIIKPNGHATHRGPVFPDPDWGDVIPPFDYTDSDGGTSHFPGLN